MLRGFDVRPQGVRTELRKVNRVSRTNPGPLPLLTPHRKRARIPLNLTHDVVGFAFNTRRAKWRVCAKAIRSATARGGSWAAGADACRSAARYSEEPGFADVCFGYDAYGFRCVRRAAR